MTFIPIDNYSISYSMLLIYSVLGNRVFECTLENGDDVLQAAFEAVVVAGLEKRWAQVNMAIIWYCTVGASKEHQISLHIYPI